MDAMQRFLDHIERETRLAGWVRERCPRRRNQVQWSQLSQDEWRRSKQDERSGNNHTA
jgi:hypothetical protein